MPDNNPADETVKIIIKPADDPVETPADYGEEEFWAEDAQRVNDLGEAAETAGVTFGSTPAPPKLNPDGSLAS